ncbi:MAG: serine hydroxymethyltransferase, partial [Candidatus Altiarchaeota archaeon]|nr:serine hydroxymethyltransferase [Candidatus Altiarchaeota archaeon]
ADLMPLSGVIANTAALMALTSYGDRIMSLSLQAGAHISQTSISSAGVLGLKSEYLVFDPEEMNIDVDKSRQKILKYRPKLVITAGSVYLFPHPVKEIKEICDEVSARVMYDGAHVAGLIAGKAFPNPLGEGCDVVTFSSHKTFPGPQGGMILCNDSLGKDNIKRLSEAAFPKLISNHHLHHVAGKAIAAAEMLEFGQGYARQIVKNAKTLAAALYAHGFRVLGEKNGFTRSHQVLVDISKEGGGSKVADSLEKANIICSKQVLPYEDEKFTDPAGIRIGTQELTRVGMKENEMDEIAGFMKRVIIDGENPESVRDDVVAFKSNYNQVHYCFRSGEAYNYLDDIYNSIQHWMK